MTTITAAQFPAIAEALYQQIEDILDNIIDDELAAIDYESGAGVISIDCEDTNTKVIISRQPATQQIWVAAKSGGFHCCHEETNNQTLWRCTTTKETLAELLSRVCTEQSSNAVSFMALESA